MENQQEIDLFSKEYCREQNLPANHTYKDAFSFGDNKELADELVELILAGKKTTTAGLLKEYEHNEWSLLEKGDQVVVLDGNQNPKCVIEYDEVEYVKFIEMKDVKFAQDEGEGFDTIEIWRNVHWRYFSRVLDDLGLKASEDMIIIKIRFRKLYP